MNNRRLVVVVILVILAVIGLAGLSFAYPFDSTEKSTPYDSLLEGENDGPYQVVMNASIDGERIIEYELSVDEDGDKYVVYKTNGSSFRAEHYSSANSTLHSKVQTSNKSAADRIADDDDFEIVERSEKDGTHTIIRESKEPASIHDELELANYIIYASSLRSDYEYISSTTASGEELHIYDPQNAWTISDYSGHRISNVDGEAHVRNHTNELQYLEVSYDFTPATSYADYYMNRDQKETMSLTYEYEESDIEIEEANWLER